MARNPPWTTDEVILALSLYFAHGQLDDTDPLAIEASKQMNALPINEGAVHLTTFRNANGVAMKLANFAHFDPAYSGDGLRGGSKLDHHLFETYSDRRDDCHKIAQALKQGIVSGDLPLVSEDDDEDAGAVEGKLLMKLHRRRERSRSNTAKKLKKAREQNGELQCEVCDLSESGARARFGEYSGELFECHHTRPLYTLVGTATTKLVDLAVVCPTCHRALHRLDEETDVPTLRGRVLADA